MFLFLSFFFFLCRAHSLIFYSSYPAEPDTAFRFQISFNFLKPLSLVSLFSVTFSSTCYTSLCLATYFGFSKIYTHTTRKATLLALLGFKGRDRAINVASKSK